MPVYLQWLLAAAALVLLAPAMIWLGDLFGRNVGRKNPGLGIALLLFVPFFKLDAPPPPPAEQVHKDDEDPGAPPKP
jgi:hypothetical protein